MYVVSGAIFPSYFLKCEELNDVMQKQAELDVTIFARYIVPVLKIKKRYVGTEVYCKTTHAYNNAMKAILPGYGVTVIEIERKSVGSIRRGYLRITSAHRKYGRPSGKTGCRNYLNSCRIPPGSSCCRKIPPRYVQKSKREKAGTCRIYDLRFTIYDCPDGIMTAGINYL